MITRDELDLYVARLDPTNFNSTAKMFKKTIEYVNDMEQHIKSLEAQLANTEQLTCGTCENLYTYKPKGYTGQVVMNPYRCTKYDIEVYCNMSCTNYTPKDTQ